jgi:cation transport ATPase
MSRLATLIISLGICTLADADTIKATIKGTDCDFCESAIEKTFRAQPEVKTVDVDLENKLVTIETRHGQTMDDSKIRKLLANAGLLGDRRRATETMTALNRFALPL